MMMILATGLIVASYQNCAGNFEFNPSNGSLSSTESGSGLVDFDFSLFKGTSSADFAALSSGQSYTLSFDGIARSSTTYNYDLTDNTAQCSLKAGDVPLARSITCLAAGTVTVRLIATWQNGSVGIKSNKLVIAAAIATGPNPNPGGGTATGADRVDFHIVAGTAARAYNTAATYVLVFLGQTLHVYNDDTIAHAVHTVNGAPFSDQRDATAAGATSDLPVTVVHEDINAGDVYDRVAGSSAVFYIKAIDGAGKYSTNCARCHGPLASSVKLGRSAAQIRVALNTQAAMAGITLSDDEVKAIAYNLGK